MRIWRGFPPADEHPLGQDRQGAHHRKAGSAEHDGPEVRRPARCRPRSTHRPTRRPVRSPRRSRGKQQLQRCAHDVLPRAGRRHRLGTGGRCVGWGRGGRRVRRRERRAPRLPAGDVRLGDDAHLDLAHSASIRSLADRFAAGSQSRRGPGSPRSPRRRCSAPRPGFPRGGLNQVSTDGCIRLRGQLLPPFLSCGLQLHRAREVEALALQEQTYCPKTGSRST